MSQQQEIVNNFESKVNVSIESNCRGYNTKITVYQGVSQEEITQTIESYKRTQRIAE
jgi:hypothetical protein